MICLPGQIGGPAREGDAALEQAVDVVGRRERLVDVLLDEQDGRARARMAGRAGRAGR